MGWGLPCDSNCSHFSWLKHLTGYWFARLDHARGEDVFADDAIELMANTFAILVALWLFLAFRRYRPRRKNS